MRERLLDKLAIAASDVRHAQEELEYAERYYSALLNRCTDEERAEERRRAMHAELQKHVA